jgi:hypothetical protein
VEAGESASWIFCSDGKCSRVGPKREMRLAATCSDASVRMSTGQRIANALPASFSPSRNTAAWDWDEPDLRVLRSYVKLRGEGRVRKNGTGWPGNR